MATFLISYDLNKPGQQYSDLIEAIKSYPDWAKLHKSDWAVVTNKTATDVRDHLVKHIDRNDTLTVITARAPAAWHGLSDEIKAWLKKNLT